MAADRDCSAELHPSPAAAEPTSIDLLPPPKTRKRGVVLTDRGWQKLLQAGVLCNQFGERYTFEHFSEQTLLDPRTVCRILGREVGVDKRSLKIFFNALSLELAQDDYTMPKQGKRELAHHPDSLPLLPLTFVSGSSLSKEETALLQQQLIETCRRFIKLHKLDNAHSITLSIKFMPPAAAQFELRL